MSQVGRPWGRDLQTARRRQAPCTAPRCRPQVRPPPFTHRLAPTFILHTFCFAIFRIAISLGFGFLSRLRFKFQYIFFIPY